MRGSLHLKGDADVPVRRTYDPRHLDLYWKTKRRVRERPRRSSERKLLEFGSARMDDQQEEFDPMSMAMVNMPGLKGGRRDQVVIDHQLVMRPPKSHCL